MKTFVTGSGAQDFSLLSPTEDWPAIRPNVIRLLKARGYDAAIDAIEKYPWQTHDATNFFGDEFVVLHASLSMEAYVEIIEKDEDRQLSTALKIVSHAIQELGHYVRFIAVSPIQDSMPEMVSEPELKVASTTVEQALADAKNLLTSSGPASAVDRVHTAIHGYIRSILRTIGIESSDTAGLTEVFKLLRSKHKAFQRMSSGDKNAEKILHGMASVVDSVNTLRNKSSIAHPNERLLQDPEAILAINAVRTLLHYLESKIVDNTKDSLTSGSSSTR